MLVLSRYGVTVRIEGKNRTKAKVEKLVKLFLIEYGKEHPDALEKWEALSASEYAELYETTLQRYGCYITKE